MSNYPDHVEPAKGAGEEEAQQIASKTGHESTLEMKDYTTTVTILESITDAIFILNARGQIEYANRSAQNYLQLPLEGIIGLDLGDFISSEADETLQVLEHKLFSELTRPDADHETFSNSEAELHGARESIPVLINFSIIPDANDQLKYIIVTAKEIAYRKSLEKELKHRQALSVSFDRLKALGEMSVGLVHTLGQPVTAMELRLEHISQLEDMVTVQLQVAELRKDIGRLSGIVEKVRSYAQVMADKQIRSLDINKAIRSVLQVLEYDLSAADVTINLDLDESIPQIEANEPELEQVFMNLITNAEQAFSVNAISAEKTVTISSKSVDNKWIQVDVEDNAGGIAETTGSKIFEPFFSTWNKEHHAGTGLSIVRSILSSLGGDINHHALENGTKFALRIPTPQSEERTQLVNLIELLNN